MRQFNHLVSRGLLLVLVVHLLAPLGPLAPRVRAEMNTVPAFLIAGFTGSLVGAVSTVTLTTLGVVAGPLGMALGLVVGPLIGHAVTISIYNGLRDQHATDDRLGAFFGSAAAAILTSVLLGGVVGPFLAGFVSTAVALLVFNLIADTRDDFYAAFSARSTERAKAGATGATTLDRVSGKLEELAERRRELYRDITGSPAAPEGEEKLREYHAVGVALEAAKSK